jgi:hypothetical protein
MKQQWHLCLFVAGIDGQTKRMMDEISNAMTLIVGARNWRVELIDVFEDPDRALEADIFATPTLVRQIPKPVMKFIGDIVMSKNLLLGVANNPDALVNGGADA